MKPPQDGTLTEEERRLFALLEDRAARAEPPVIHLPDLQPTPMSSYSRTLSNVSPWLVLLVGTVLMLTTFARWPAAGIAGVLLDAIGLWLVLVRRARSAGVAPNRRASNLRSRE
jgi:hypothetical protein